MHCDVDLRSRRMWAASYRLTRLEMNENSEYLESFCTGHARFHAERGGAGGDGAVALCCSLDLLCCIRGRGCSLGLGLGGSSNGIGLGLGLGGSLFGLGRGGGSSSGSSVIDLGPVAAEDNKAVLGSQP